MHKVVKFKFSKLAQNPVANIYRLSVLPYGI